MKLLLILIGLASIAQAACLELEEITICRLPVSEMPTMYGSMTPTVGIQPHYLIKIREDRLGSDFMQTYQHELCHVRQSKEGRPFDEEECNKAGNVAKALFDMANARDDYGTGKAD